MRYVSDARKENYRYFKKLNIPNGGCVVPVRWVNFTF